MKDVKKRGRNAEKMFTDRSKSKGKKLIMPTTAKPKNK